MTKNEAIAIEAERVEVFSSMAEHAPAQQAAKWQRRAHFSYLAMIRLERAS